MGEGTGGVDPRTLTTITISFQYNVSYLPRMHLWAISDIAKILIVVYHPIDLL
ncbi:hypothetical protein K443DRAFT_686694 [Laccaria amethystina LaAM-08-1]|uniref:Uncharacterized protein n=1 Tax=Laccaria amethystina LaAM-08-1 TaxID=1095629 RepID=A0A0C9X210_9AGAR|nr:hypothetical protein K443DRAFT_686694 [Laccaria amethystina LaAM-08-1]